MVSNSLAFPFAKSHSLYKKDWNLDKQNRITLFLRNTSGYKFTSRAMLEKQNKQWTNITPGNLNLFEMQWKEIVYLTFAEKIIRTQPGFIADRCSTYSPFLYFLCRVDGR